MEGYSLMCTNFAYPAAKDGTTCIGRTMEFPNEIPWELAVTASDMKGDCTLVPNGKTWQATYGVVGMSAFSNPQWFADGMNTAGLSAHLLYMPDHATYSDPKGDGSDIGILDLIAFVLGTCSTLAEAKAAALTVNVVNVNPKEIPIPLPLHLVLHDKDSCAVVEFHPEGPKVLDNPVRCRGADDSGAARLRYLDRKHHGAGDGRRTHPGTHHVVDRVQPHRQSLSLQHLRRPAVVCHRPRHHGLHVIALGGLLALGWTDTHHDLARVA